MERAEKLEVSSITGMFTAVTLRPSRAQLAQPFVRRERLLRFLNYPPVPGAVPVISGPIGSGKTFLALQWIQDLGEDNHYVSSRLSPDIPKEWIAPPSPVGLAAAEFLNLSCQRSVAPSFEDTSRLLNTFLDLLAQTTEPYVLDGLEVLSLVPLPSLNIALERGLVNYQGGKAMLISRAVGAATTYALQSMGALQLILPAQINFDREESALAHEIGVFGSADVAAVEQAYADTSGWILGMLTSLGTSGGKTVDIDTFHSMVVNEMFLPQRNGIQHLIISAAYLEEHSYGIWERWFNYLNIPHYFISGVQSQLPSVAATSQNAFRVVPTMREALIGLRSVAVDQKQIDTMLDIAMEWYIEQGDIDAAIGVATRADRVSRLLDLLRPGFADHASREAWDPVMALINKLSWAAIIRDRDFPFWMMMGLLEQGSWSQVRRLYHRSRPHWEASNDPLALGRSYLLQAWEGSTSNRAVDALAAATRSWETLPEYAHQERLWAAATAGTADSYLAISPSNRTWWTRANAELVELPRAQRWWNRTVGPVRLSWLAMQGKMTEALQFSERKFTSLGDVLTSELVRYHSLSARIETEMMRFEDAHASIARGRALSSGPSTGVYMLDLAEITLACVEGDLDKALALAASTPSLLNHQRDLSFRDKVYRAWIAILQDDLETSEMMMDTSAAPSDTWPKYFGDPHPDLILAMLGARRGEIDQAIRKCQGVIDEARRRGHTYFVVAGYTHLAFLLHMSDREAERDIAVEQAIRETGSAGYQLIFFVGNVDVRTLGKKPASLSESPRRENRTIVSSPNGFHHDDSPRLTERELEVVVLLAKRMSNKEIAEELYISVSTVKNHLKSVYTKLGTRSRRETIDAAKRLRLVQEATIR